MKNTVQTPPPEGLVDDPPDPEMGNDLNILMPERTLELSTGETVTVHEYTFMEGMNVDVIAAGMITALTQLFYANVDADQDLHLQELLKIFASDTALMAKMLSIACKRDTDWVEGLADSDGQLLLMTWWEVNRNFFVRRLISELGPVPMLDPIGGGSSPY